MCFSALTKLLIHLEMLLVHTSCGDMGMIVIKEAEVSIYMR